MTSIVINNKTPEQLRKIVRKCIKNGEFYIQVKQSYVEPKNPKRWSFDKVLTLQATTYKTENFGTFFNHDSIIFTNEKKDFEDRFHYLQGNMCRTFTGMKFEFEWEEGETVENFVLNHPFNEFYD